MQSQNHSRSTHMNMLCSFSLDMPSFCGLPFAARGDQLCSFPTILFAFSPGLSRAHPQCRHRLCALSPNRNGDLRLDAAGQGLQTSHGQKVEFAIQS